jgi:hypothetical protein
MCSDRQMPSSAGVPTRTICSSFASIAFAVRQEPQLLEHREVQMLRFVDDEHGRRIQRNQGGEEPMQRCDEVMPARTIWTSSVHHAEVLEHLEEQFLDSHAGIDDDADGVMGGKPRQQRAAQEGFPGAGLPYDQHQTFTLLDGRGDLFERPDV